MTTSTQCPFGHGSTLPEGAFDDFSRDMSYGDYLGLDHLLVAQKPLSKDHNELLFIIQHQTTELWMKLMLHELTAARGRIIADDLQPAFRDRCATASAATSLAEHRQRRIE